MKKPVPVQEPAFFAAFLYYGEEVKPRTCQTRPASSQVRSHVPHCRVRRDGALAVPKQMAAEADWADGTRLRVCHTTLHLGALSADAVTIKTTPSGLQVVQCRLRNFLK